MQTTLRERAVDAIDALAKEGLDVVSFWRAANEVIRPALSTDGGLCWFTLDPASLLVTSHYNEEMPELPHKFLAHQYYEDDCLMFSDVARSAGGVSTLHDETNGDPASSPMFRKYVEPYGGEQVMAVRLRAKGDDVWGILTLYRYTGRELFDQHDKAFVQAISGPLAEGARRGLLIGEATDPEGPEAPGLIVLGKDWSVESITSEAERWLGEFPDSIEGGGDLPSAVYAVAGRAARTATDFDDPGEVATARVLSRSGRWIALHGASLMTNGERRAAVIIEAAQPARISPLLMAAYGLTEREQEVTKLVLQAASTAEIAARLYISEHTVQQHLKNIFEKTGVRSRRDLVGKIFFSHYEPRVRDNDLRSEADRPFRGGPLLDPARRLT